jgi:glyoxylase I family protein
MAIDHLLAVVPVSDIDAAGTWYESLIGRQADNNPMPTLVEWQLVDSGWLQVFVDADRAGSGLLNFAVDNLEHHIAELRLRGLRPGEIVDANKGVRLSTISDPDGNTITLIGGFRIKYLASIHR